jgi:peptidyl-prolyl cis-trans isomerase-like 4
MSVLIETTRGDIVIDLLLKEAPIACKNFLKLCKIKAYNNCTFFNVQKNFLIQSGDPTNTGKGGESIYGYVELFFGFPITILRMLPLLADRKLFGEQAKFFEDEIHPRRKPKLGSVCMANAGPNMNTSQVRYTGGGCWLC